MNPWRISAVLLLCVLAAPAFAHHLWLEQEGQVMRIAFGEFGENLREASPGTLDRIQPQAKAVSSRGERKLGVEKSANGYVVSGKAEAGESIVAEDVRYPAFDRKRDGKKGIYRPAARFIADRTPHAAVLDLDIVPVSADRFKVMFKGKPLPKAKVSVVTQSGWGRDVYTGENGEFSVALPWRGTYVLEVQHTDDTPGKRGEEAYDFMNLVTSLTVVQPQGVEPLPAPPPAKPH